MVLEFRGIGQGRDERLRDLGADAVSLTIGGILCAEPSEGFGAYGPGTLADVHLEDGESERVGVHPGLDFGARGLRKGAVFEGVAGGAVVLVGGVQVEDALVGGILVRSVLVRSVLVGSGWLLLAGVERQVCSGFCQAEIGDLGVPFRAQKNVAGLDILVDDVVHMGIVEPAGGLNRNVQNPLLNFLGRAVVELAVMDPVAKAAAVHPFGKDRGHAADVADIVAGDDIGIETEVDPVDTLLDEVFFAGFSGFGKKSRLRALHSKICTPGHVVDAPNAAHSAADGIGHDFVGVLDQFALFNYFVGDGGLIVAVWLFVVFLRWVVVLLRTVVILELAVLLCAAVCVVHDGFSKGEEFIELQLADGVG